MQREYFHMKQTIMTLIVGLFGSLLCVAGMNAQTKNQSGQTPIYQDRDGYQVLSVLLNARSDEWKNGTIEINPRTASGKAVAEIKAQCTGIPTEFQAASQDF